MLSSQKAKRGTGIHWTLGEQQDKEQHSLRVEEMLGLWGDESSFSGTEGAERVHNDAIWSSHGAMHTLRLDRLLSLLELATAADADVWMVSSVCMCVRDKSTCLISE